MLYTEGLLRKRECDVDADVSHTSCRSALWWAVNESHACNTYLYRTSVATCSNLIKFMPQPWPKYQNVVAIHVSILETSLLRYVQAHNGEGHTQVLGKFLNSSVAPISGSV